jgi:hypothetical protein
MVVVPVLTPVIMPDDDPAVATVVFVLVQVPPVTTSLKVIVFPVQSVGDPLIAEGKGLTVTVFNA